MTNNNFKMSAQMPELGSKITLISKADIRYEGRLFTVDPQECTIALANGKKADIVYVTAGDIIFRMVNFGIVTGLIGNWESKTPFLDFLIRVIVTI